LVERAWMVDAVVMREEGYGEGTVGRSCDSDLWMASMEKVDVIACQYI